MEIWVIWKLCLYLCMQCCYLKSGDFRNYLHTLRSFSTIVCSCVLHFREPSILDECQLDEKTKEILITNINRRMMPQAVKVRSDIEVSCYSYEGIDAVKEALRQGLKHSTEDLPVKVRIVMSRPLRPSTLVLSTMNI